MTGGGAGVSLLSQKRKHNRFPCLPRHATQSHLSIRFCPALEEIPVAGEELLRGSSDETTEKKNETPHRDEETNKDTLLSCVLGRTRNSSRMSANQRRIGSWWRHRPVWQLRCFFSREKESLMEILFSSAHPASSLDLPESNCRQGPVFSDFDWWKEKPSAVREVERRRHGRCRRRVAPPLLAENEMLTLIYRHQR